VAADEPYRYRRGLPADRAQIPYPEVRNQRRMKGNGRDAVVSHGGWLVFGFMALPSISVEDAPDVGVLERLA
jgi:hypothetical protein